jgi:hypothetical protein
MKTKTKMIKPFLVSFLLLAFTLNTFAGEVPKSISQNIRGQVIDKQSQTPLPGVNVYVEQNGKKIGTTTDFDGYYLLKGIQIGRINIYFTFIGYEPVLLSNIELLGSKELLLNTSLLEKTEKLAEVTVLAKVDKLRTKNDRVNVSGRSFSVEETQRFAGANNDISRMAANFAGVQRSNDAANDIVIRGNSPFGLIWRLEGVDIPNPNHFGSAGATGGPISMLNNNVLANSDFLTGAFPSDYGDGISGVFDLKMRNGNYDKHEFLGQIGFNGFELGAEGPINREKKSSYLINYRYSTLGAMAAMGISFGTGAAVPQYQDLNLKLNFPSRKIGNIQVFALAGISSIDFLDSENEEEESDGFYSENEDLRNRVNTGVAGISHQYFFSNKTYSKVVLSLNGIQNKTRIDTFNVDGSIISPMYGQDFIESNLQAHALLNHKLNVRNVIRVGAFITRRSYDLLDSSYSYTYGDFVKNRDTKGNNMLYQPYINWQWRISDKLEMNTGLHSIITPVNNQHSVEPRWGMSYNLSPKSSVSLGYGLHSQLPFQMLQYRQIRQSNGSFTQPNLELDYVKSHHYVAGFQHRFNKGWNFKGEVYYQSIYNAIVDQESNSYSSLNSGSFNFGSPDSASNNGTGHNYGLDLTAEKFMDKGFYLLSTLSVFQSKYTASDNIERNTAFNGNYVWNVVSGKEFLIRKNKGKARHTITTDAKITLAGGQRYTPMNPTASAAAGEAVYDNSNAFGAQYDAYFRADVRIGYKITASKFTQEWAVDIQNLTNKDNPFGQRFDAATNTIETTYQLGLFPMFLYRLTF